MVCDCYSKESLNKVLELKSDYNIPFWLSASQNQKISEFRFDSPQIIEFYFNNNEKEILSDGFRRYGTDLNGLMTLIQRLAGSLPMRTATVSNKSFAH